MISGEQPVEMPNFEVYGLKKEGVRVTWESQIETVGGGRGPKDFQEQVQNNIAILHLFINSIGKNNYVYECISSSQQQDSRKQFLKK